MRLTSPQLEKIKERLNRPARIRAVWVCIAVALNGFLPLPLAAQGTDFPSRFAALERDRETDEANRLGRLLDLHWEYQMTEYPTYATYVGYPGQDDRWTDMSAEAVARREAELRDPLAAVTAIRADRLDATDRLNHDLLRRKIEDEIRSSAFPGEFLVLNQLGGVQQDIPRQINMMPARTESQFLNIIARLEKAPALIGQNIDLMRRGIEAGVVPPRVTLRDVPDQIEALFSTAAADSPLYRPFLNPSPDIPVSRMEELRARALSAIEDGVQPAFRELHNFVVGTYLPAARESVGWSELPQGREWYEERVRHYTTTDMTAEEIHELGLSEVRRIRAEMDEVIRSTGFEGTFEEFCRFLQEDPRFYYTKAEDLLAGYRDIAKRLDPELITLFGRLPRIPYGVKEIPAYTAKSQTTAYYMGGSPDAGRPGWFYANTYALETRPKWEMEALTAHEAVPGHHLQISLAQEAGDMPEFRRYGGYTAFVEGWGLYAESLGEEMGLYQDPYSKFGQLTYEMWRAVRLVVDTGMHSKGWSRERAIDFFKANSSKQEHDIVVEIDRYIVRPGQALAYKIGELTFKNLRAEAKERLGERFDVREFHDELLSRGALPMDLTREFMTKWMEEKAAETRAK